MRRVYHRPVDCLDEATLLAAVEGRLSSASQGALDAHLDGCAGCLQLFCHAAALGSEPSSDEPPDRLPEAPSGRYELATEIGRGGMGRVFLARDRWLGRDVAIKQGSAALAERFRREIALTASLEHPSIVPVHDAGVFRDGTPYYAMRLFGGTTLARLAERATRVVDRLALLPHVVAVANAVAHAHRQGVLHRDIKPHNIVVGDLGETMLIDWGLARRLGGEPERAVVGTPGFMAPEQARGEATGPTADVFSLGATLQHVLTRGGVAHDEMPRDLVAIVDRAMAPRPEDRYPTAEAMAADLSRFLTGQLVEARRYSPAARLVRWARRHRAVVIAAGVGVVALAVVSGLALRRILAERANAIAARARAEQARDAAEGLVTFLVGDLQRNLAGLGRLDLFAAASAEVEGYYQRVGLESATRADALIRRAAAFRILGETKLEGGDSTRAEEQLRAGLQLAELAVTRGGEGADEAVCRIELKLADALVARGRDDDAASLVSRCDGRARAKIAAAPGDPAWRGLLAGASIRRARRAHQRGEMPEARRLLEEGRALSTALLDEKSAEVPLGAAGANLQLAQWAREDRDPAAASRAAQACVDVAARSVALAPEALDRQFALHACWDELGSVRLSQQDLAGAAAAFETARDVIHQLVAREPANQSWRRALGISEDRLAGVALARGDPRRALEHYRAGRDVSAELARREPASADLRYDLSISDFTLASLYDALGDATAAERSFRLCLDEMREARTIDPKNQRFVVGLATELASVAQFALGRGQRAWARDAAAESLELGRRVLAAEDTPSSRLTVGLALLFLSSLDPARERALLAEATQLSEPLRHHRDDPNVVSFLDALDRAAARAPR